MSLNTKSDSRKFQLRAQEVKEQIVTKKEECDARDRQIGELEDSSPLLL